MKQFKIAVIALFTLVTVSNVSAQDASNPWAVSAGITIVDVRGNVNFGDILKDYLELEIGNLVFLEFLEKDILQMILPLR